MPLHPWFSVPLCGALLSVAGAAELPVWRNAQGRTFHAQPVEALGPFALFGPEATTNRLLKFRALTDDDCVRFHAAVAPRPPRAARWSDAQGALTRALVGRVRPVLTPDRASGDLTTLPEPELLLIYYHTSPATSAEASQDTIMQSLEPFARRLRRIYPGRVEVVAAIAGPDGPDLPPASAFWMTANPERLAEVPVLRALIPAVTSGLALFTREGVPIAGGSVRDIFSLARMIDHVSALLWDLNPDNRHTLPERAHYRRAVRAAQFATGAAPPEMLADPLPVDLLRRLNVSCLDARLELDTNARVTRVTLRPGSRMPSAATELVSAAFRGTDVFLPALQDGKPVPGVIDYSFVVPSPPDPQFAAEIAWVQGEARIRVPIPSWLVLRPIRVDERVLTTVNRIGADGTVVLNPVTAGTARIDSFREDWFEHAGGAGGVQPQAGQEQAIGSEKLVWQRVSPIHDFVDLALGAGPSDSCVGYAWTEVESPAETDAWLGIGSDDGHKVWVNGRLIADSWVVRPSRLDDDVVPFRLRAGRNTILVKIQNETAAWSFVARLRVRAQ